MPAEKEPLYAQCLERIGDARLSAEAAPVIEDLFWKYREGYLACLQNYQPLSQKEAEYLSRILMKKIFTTYYNHILYR